MVLRSAVLPLVLVFTACSDEVAGTPLDTACKITARVRLADPPEGWTPGAGGKYRLHRFEDFVLYTFDDAKDPARLYWRLDPCTGETTPFPSLAPGLGNPFLLDTPVGRVLYAVKDGDYFVVDRVDDPGDDVAGKIAGLPRPGFLDFNLWNAWGAPYALFFRDTDLYSHAGDPAVPALRVAVNTAESFPYEDAVLVADSTGLRRVDPFTGTSELLLGGAQRVQIVYDGGSIADARVIWQPAGESTLYLRRLGEGKDLALDIAPTIVDLGLETTRYWPELDIEVVTFLDPSAGSIVAAARTDTGVAIVVPDHVGVYHYSGRALSLTLPDPDAHVEAIWEPETGALREWYRGPTPAPWLQAAEGDHVDYYVRGPTMNEGSLWRVDLDTGERRLLLPRMSEEAARVTPNMYLMQFDVSAPASDTAELFDLEYIDVESGRSTRVAGSVSDAAHVPGDGVIYLDAHGAEPGVWAAPQP